MKTCQSSIKQRTWQQKGTKRYKMEGPKSWQTKKAPKRANCKGMGTNQVSKPLHPQPLKSSCEKHKARILVKIFRVCMLACEGRRGEELWELDIRFLVQFWLKEQILQTPFFLRNLCSLRKENTEVTKKRQRT